ncbi:MAG: BofC C-terminal domain-containing protein [Thermicanus sp.]|nr:BofC C-terminal domain-containing protein [Thermicanus sp.]
MSSWLKRLLRKLRVKRPAQLLASLLFFLVALSVLFNQDPSSSTSPGGGNEQKEEITAALAPNMAEVIFRTIYEVGPVEEEVKKLPYSELENLKKKYGNLTPYGANGDRFIVEKRVEDLSPFIKERGKLGLTKEGMLMLYTGSDIDPQVIETFFRIDVKRMESSLPQEEVNLLRQGIPVHSLAEFNSILSTYGEYALYRDETDPVEN